MLLKALDRLGRVELSQEIAWFSDVNRDALRALKVVEGSVFST